MRGITIREEITVKIGNVARKRYAEENRAEERKEKRERVIG